MEDFVVVKHKRRSRNNNRDVTYVPHSDLLSNEDAKFKKCKKLVTEIHQLQNDMQSSDFYNHFKDILHRALPTWVPNQIICYGLGRITESVTSRHQMAFVASLIFYLKTEPKKCIVYDPILTSDDCDVIKQFNFSVSSINQEGKYTVGGLPTLFFMPHCGKALFNNLLWANWSYYNLTSIVIIGNSFQQMVDSVLPSQVRKSLSYIFKILPHTTEIQIDNIYRFTDIFNDLSIHLFSGTSLSDCPETFWSDSPEPVYDAKDVEIILNND